ncbi:MAG: aspartate--tRNA ligase [Candidatus Diapherotrites archaeon]|uniref:Aspartate--tRNA(Asp/Asn) ligase n=1 Tax=Candidatus Iainarchaeum sp. TaxID=3101447 RepID=A0A938YNR5_9ARCH|nr:aspartate--tRNA ligase [Candidatus Diapherotrites archaeon]
MKRTHTCGELTEKSRGKKAVLQGWVSKRRDHGNLIFIDLRDRYGVTQVVFNPKDSKEAHKEASKLGKEFVVQVEGKVGKRPKGTENKAIKTGKIELNATSLEILNPAETPLPIEIDEHLLAGEDQRLKYRFLDLRRAELQQNLILRHKVVKAFRDFFDKEHFLEIETPFLAKSTPEGARDFLVPSRVHPGKFYALPQSPQLFKQILMVSGFDRYVQIVRCFRDEDLRADRQLEFTQVDVEMSFVGRDDIIGIMERAMQFVFKQALGIKVKAPFPRLSFDEAMNIYGSDKPDNRFELHLVDVTKELSGTDFEIFNKVIENKGVIKALKIDKGCKTLNKKDVDKLTEVAKLYKAKGLMSIWVKGKEIESQIAKFLPEKTVNALLSKVKAKDSDLVLLVADSWLTACNSLGYVRLALGEKLGLIDRKKFSFLWVLDFPLLEWNDEEQRFQAMHHPFTSPRDEDIPLLDSQPEKAKAKAYDLVLNGSEIGGGSIRIHRGEIQEKMFNALGISRQEAEAKFGFLLSAFKFGAPPHGGIALGLDRIIAIMAGCDSIREVIAFPKNKAAVSLMDDAPNEVSERQLKELSLKLDIEKPLQ